MALDKVTTKVIADANVTAAKVASDVATVAGTQTLTNKTLTSPSISDLSYSSGNLGAVERTSLTSPNTVTASYTTGDTLNSAATFSGDIFGSSNVALFAGTNVTAAALTFDYGSGVSKYLRYIQWDQVDGQGNSTGLKIRASNNGTSWTDITTITSGAFVNGTTYSYRHTGTTGYRYWQLYYTYSSANHGNVKNFRIYESDISTPLVIDNPGIKFPDGHIIQSKMHVHTGAQVQVTSNSFNNSDIIASTKFKPLVAGSDILLIGCVAVYCTSEASYIYVDFYRNADDFSENVNLSGEPSGITVTNHSSSWDTVNPMYLDTRTPKSTAVRTYAMSARVHSNGQTGWFGWGEASDTRLMIFEIANNS